MEKYFRTFEYHVSPLGNDESSGTLEAPFKTISQAAKIAKPGDMITVHEGVYREWVKPANSGESELKRIIYRAAENERVVIKGSEIINTWSLLENDVWKITLDNSFFGDYNPYKDVIYGDWYDNWGRGSNIYYYHLITHNSLP